MQPLSRFIGTLLLIAFSAATLSAHPLMLPAQTAHPAGCHGHGSPTPTAPVSYQCCISGHHRALPGNFFSGAVLLSDFGRTSDSGGILPAYHLTFRPVFLISSSPGSPGLTSLRV